MGGPAGGWPGHTLIAKIVMRCAGGVVELERRGEFARALAVCLENGKAPA